jgi:hypothetical protein
MRRLVPIRCRCKECDRDFERWSNRGALDICSPCSNLVRVRTWKRANPERTRSHGGYGGTTEQKKRYAVSDRGKAMGRLKARRWYWKDPDAARAANRSRYIENRDREIQKVIERVKKIAEATPPWADRQAIAAIYADARRLTRKTGVGHHVDHIMPLRGANCCGLHVQWNLRIVPAEMNQKKSNILPPSTEWLAQTEGNA